jgi:hypothetical protein
MDANCKEIFKLIGVEIDINNLEDLNFEIEREILLDENKYKMIKAKIVELKQIASSNNLTCLHENAQNKQKWPLLNLIRQLLRHYKYDLKPIRKCDGYTLDGIKKFKRYFLIRKQ